MKCAIDILLDYCKNNWDTIIELEKYKWIAVEIFQNNYNRIFDKTEKLDVVLKDAFSGEYNLFYFAQKDSLISNAKYAADDVREALSILYDKENRSLEERVKIYREMFREITIRNNSMGYFSGQTKSHKQDDRTISVLLFLRYPEEYYIYMSSIFEEASTQLTSEYCYHRTKIENVNNLQNFFKFCNDVKYFLMQDNDLINRHNQFIKSNNIKDYSKGNLLTQTFLYSICRHRKAKTNYAEYNILDSTKIDLLTPPGIEFKRLGCNVDYVKETERQIALGRQGEFFVVAHENKRLRNLGLKCKHISIEKGGDGCGYDIFSYEDDGITPRYIEVKTTLSDFSSPFYMSQREIEFSKQERDKYYLYRVYNFDANQKRGEIDIIKGSMEKYAEYPTQYKIALKKL